MTTAPAIPKLPTSKIPVGPAPVGDTAKLLTLDMTPRKPAYTGEVVTLYGVEGIGKSTIGAYADLPVILMAPGQTGYTKLLQHSSVPSVPALDIKDWPHLLQVLRALVANSQGRKTVVLDALADFQQLCEDYVLKTVYRGDGIKFTAYGAGVADTRTEWVKLMVEVGILREKGLDVILLGHAKVEKFKDPLGADYDRYVCNLDKELWQQVRALSDAVMFINYFSVVVVSTSQDRENVADKRGKGIGQRQRVAYTDRRDAFDAKNRHHGMPEVIDVPNEASQAYQSIFQYIHKEQA